MKRGTRRIAVLIARLGPYHVARLSAAATLFSPECCTALEVAAESREYAWDKVSGGDFIRETLITDRDYQDVPPGERCRLVLGALDRLHPEAVAVSGWGFPEGLAAMRWCRAHGRVAILLSETQERDFVRSWPREAYKRRLLRGFDSALVGGERHVQYLETLGMDRRRVATGYDVVDNDHFGRAAAAIRTSPSPRMEGIPSGGFFLCSARFIEKKNLVRLVEAYARFRATATSCPWGLVLLGDGPLMTALRARVKALDIEGAVHFPGFRQYEELPDFYGRATAFILPSTTEQWGLVTNEAMASGLPVLISDACGSAELVTDGVNGFRFNPLEVTDVEGAMLRLWSNAHRLESMGNESRVRISRLAPAAFGEGLADALVKGERHLAGRGPKLLGYTVRT